MFKSLKKIPWDKIKFKRKVRNADELFSSGKIFEARDKELDSILKELTMKPNPNIISQHRDTIRAITVLAAKSNKTAEKAQFFNIVFSVIIVALTIFSFCLMRQQTEYAEMSVRDIKIKDAQGLERAKEYCKENPDAEDSGMFYTNSGKPAPCSEVLKLNK